MRFGIFGSAQARRGGPDVDSGSGFTEFAGFCIPMDEADERFEESLAVLRKAWTSDTPWSHRGKYWRFDNVVGAADGAEAPPAAVDGRRPSGLDQAGGRARLQPAARPV